MDKYDKMTNETLKEKDKDYNLTVYDKVFMDKNDHVISLDSVTYSNGTSEHYYGDYIDYKTMINGYEIKPELMDKIKSFEDFNIFLEKCKNNVIEDANRQKTATVLSRTIETNYDKKEIKLLVEYLQEMLKNSAHI